MRWHYYITLRDYLLFIPGPCFPSLYHSNTSSTSLASNSKIKPPRKVAKCLGFLQPPVGMTKKRSREPGWTSRKISFCRWRAPVEWGGNASLFQAFLAGRQAILAIHCFYCFLTTALPFNGQPGNIGWRVLKSTGGIWSHLKTLVTFPKLFHPGSSRQVQTLPLPLASSVPLWKSCNCLCTKILQFSSWKERKGGRERGKAILHGCCETSWEKNL